VKRVYAGLQRTGAEGEVLRGAQLALDGRAELVVLDEPDPYRAVADPDAHGYLGGFRSAHVHDTAPLLAEAGLLQVAPAATWIELGGPALVRLMPHDGVLARGIARWMAAQGITRTLVVHDHDDEYGVPVGTMCAEAARSNGIETRAIPVWDCNDDIDLHGEQAVLYAGVAGSGAVGLWQALHERDPDLHLLGTDGVATAWLARDMGEGPARRTRFFGAQRAPWGFYGYEAMALILDSLGDDRAATLHAARTTRDRDSILGRYSIDADGLTTTEEIGVLAVHRGELIWAHP
jgi:branched-chain amino acid transport system substrate-binding protein